MNQAEHLQIDVPAGYVRALVQAMAEQGKDVPAFLATESLNADALESASRIQAVVFGRLYQRAMWALQDESLGMASGGPVATGTFRMLCLCAIHCRDIDAIVRRAGEFFAVCQSVAIRPDLRVFGQLAHIGFAGVGELGERGVQDLLMREGVYKVRTSLYLWYALLNWFAGRRLKLERVELSFEAPDNASSWASLFGCPVRFAAPGCRLVVPVDELAAPNVQTESTLAVFLKSVPFRLMVPSFEAPLLGDRVVSLLGDDFSRPLPGAETVAQQLGLSVSTLRRQLLSEGTSFQRLKDECRCTAAIRYLAAPGLTLGEVGRLVGFDEPSAFFRAFKRWTGSTPGEYRNTLLDHTPAATGVSAEASIDDRSG